MPGELFRFKEFELGRSAFKLRRDGQSVHLERIPLELLCLLVERNGRLVTRAEIIASVWGKDVYLDTEHAVNTAIRKIRQALKDDSDAPRFVLTVPAKGYRFVASVEKVEPAAAPGASRAYTLRGETVKARAAYQDFFTLWKDADPDVPLLLAAKAEYPKLREQ